MIKKGTKLLLLLLVISSRLMAQDVDMADAMRTEGKIYVVVAVLSVIFAGIVVYLIALDKKMTRLEKQHKK